MIFFSDMDGTFLNSHKEVCDLNWQALDAIAAAGHQFVPCTGRAMSDIYPEILDHPAVRYVVSANGAAVTDIATGKVIHRKDLGHARAFFCHELAEGRDVTFDIFADGCCYTPRSQYDRLEEFVPNDPFMLKGMLSARVPYDADVRDFMLSCKHIERIAYYWRDPADRDAIEISLLIDPTMSCVRSYATNIEVSDAEAIKGDALIWLCEHLGIPRTDAVAFGDNINDLSMIEEAGRGVAVANAEREVRDAANEVCAANDAGGPGAYILTLLGV